MDNYFLQILILFTKILNSLLTKLRIGSGNTLPGYLALKFYPNLFKHSNLFPKKGIVFISATNGKTTTTKIITHVLQKSGFKVTTNSSGSNLLRGIVTTLLLNADLKGDSKSDFGIFEVDEFALPQLIKKVKPTVVALLNLSRDQLDRYGETDTILYRWRDSLAELNYTLLVLPKGDTYFYEAFNSIQINTSFFEPVTFPQVNSVLSGKYNELNLGAALVILEKFNISKDVTFNHLKDFVLAWGRGEEINYKNNIWKIYLAKNPASFHVNLDELISTNSLREVSDLLFILNDNIPDGRDVSWIYDIDAHKLKNACDNKNVSVTGTRGLDMAVRINYCGFKLDESNVSSSLEEVVQKYSAKNSNKHITVLANYSAMLQLRKILTGRSIL